MENITREPITCEYCEGTGRVEYCIDGWNYHRDCHTQEYGTMECDKCHGTGTVACFYCGDEAVTHHNGDAVCADCLAECQRAEGEEDGQEALPATVTPEALPSLIAATNGRFFAVTFTKKDGTTRLLNGRTAVTRHLHGGKRTTDPAQFATVYDVHAKGYRSVNYSTIQALVIGGRRYTVAASA